VVKTIVEKLKSLRRMQQRYRRQTDRQTEYRQATGGRLMPESERNEMSDNEFLV